MVDGDDLIAAVEHAFIQRGGRALAWPNPHEGLEPAEEEYSRVTNPGRFRILGVRVEAWFDALVQLGLATVERDIKPRWTTPPHFDLARVDRANPVAPGAIPLIIGRIDPNDLDAGVTIGVGDAAAIVVNYLPVCGCDACDNGSDIEIEYIDDVLLAVATGVFRFLQNGDEQIHVTVNGYGHESKGRIRHRTESVLRDPTGWDEWSGASWLAAG